MAGVVDDVLGLRSLPKAELHLHFESSLRESTAREWAERSGRPMPRLGPFSGLTEFVVAYEAARDLIETSDDLQRAAIEIVEDAAEQGVVWSEVHLIPPTYAGRLGPDEAILEAVLDGFAEGARRVAAAGRSGAAAVIIGVNRGLGPEAAERSLNLAARYAGRGVVGLGLAGDEANHPPELFADVFQRARESGLRALPHAGEGAGAHSVRTAIEALCADRVCHGVRAVEDREVVDLLRERGVTLDVCPSSNVSLQVSPSLAAHQVVSLMDAEVRVTLNSDGPLFSGATINDEYRNGYEHMHLGAQALANIARTSLVVSACPEHVRRSALAGIESWTLRHGSDGSSVSSFS